MRKERYQELIPLSRCHPHTLGLSLSSPPPTQAVVPSPRPWTQPGPPPLSEAWSDCSQWAPAPSLGPQEVPVPPTGCRGRGAEGREREEKRDSLAGGARRAAAGGGGRERSGKRRGGLAGWRGRGRLRGGGRGGDKSSGRGAVWPLTWVPAQAPGRCLQRSVGPPGCPRASASVQGLGQPQPAREARAAPHPEESPREGGRGAGPGRAGATRAEPPTEGSRRAGREEGRKERAERERASRRASKQAS